METKIAAIVPAFNEEATIGNVVQALKDSGVFSDVIVVSDGSTDKTEEVARHAGAVCYEIPRNRGKGQAMQHGIAHTDAQIIFFADADLYGFKKEHMEAVLAPVLSGEAAMSVGIRDRGPFLMRAAMYLPLIGGERALLRNVFEHVPDKFLKGFMVEAALNYHAGRHKLKIKRVPMPGVTIKRKMQKVGFIRGLWGYIAMIWQIVKAMVWVRLGGLGKNY